MSDEPLDLAPIEARHPLARNGLCARHQGDDGPCEPRALLAEVKRLRAKVAEAERRGAEKALRDAARSVYNGAPDLEASRGRFHIQSLYNEGASPWLESLADAITNPTPKDTP